MKGADQVLAGRVIDAGLSADRRVRHRAGRRRDGVPGDAAEQDRRRESGDVGDDAAADGDERVVAPQAGGEARASAMRRDGVERLRFFAVVEHDVGEDPTGQRAADPVVGRRLPAAARDEENRPEGDTRRSSAASEAGPARSR